MLEHLYSLGPNRQRPDAIELHIREAGGALEMVALSFGAALRHILVERAVREDDPPPPRRAHRP